MRRWKRGKLPVLLILFQVIFIVLFSLFAEYDRSADPRFRSFGGDAETVETDQRYYGSKW